MTPYEKDARRIETELSAAASPSLAYRKMSEIESRPIDWLWRPWIAKGKVTMIAGNPGLGKSQATLGIAAAVSTGGELPDGTFCATGKVLVLSAEDDAADTIRPRLEAAGADLDRVFTVDAVTEGFLPDGSQSQRPFSLAEDLQKLGTVIETEGGASLVVIDPITAYLGSTDSHKNADMRALLAPLSKFAEQRGVAVVCVSHLNKSGGNDPLMRVTGSLAFVAAARAAYLVTKDTADEVRRLFLPLKNNLGADQTGLAFHVDSVQVPSAAGLIETSRVVWETEAVTITATEALRAAAGGSEETGAVSDAGEWLTQLLSDGPLAARAIRSEADGAGYAWRTIQRAKSSLGIEAFKDGLSSGWLWRLAEERHEERQQKNLAAFEERQRPSKSANGLASGKVGVLQKSVEVEL